MEWLLEIVLVLLLAATLFHALRLERALGVLKRDRAALEALVSEFNASTQAAEQGVDRLHAAAEGAGRQISRHVDQATRLKDDLVFLAERGGRLADRLDHLVRAARGLELAEPRVQMPSPVASPVPPRVVAPVAEPPPDVVTEMGSGPLAEAAAEPPSAAPAPSWVPAGEPPTRLRSQAERDLLRALRLAR